MKDLRDLTIPVGAAVQVRPEQERLREVAEARVVGAARIPAEVEVELEHAPRAPVPVEHRLARPVKHVPVKLINSFNLIGGFSFIIYLIGVFIFE